MRQHSTRPSLLATLLVAMTIANAASAAEPTTAPADPQEILRQLGSRGVRVHDPSTIIRCKDEFWIFRTGQNTPTLHSKDLITWEPGPPAIANPPAWVKQAVPLNRGADFG